MRSGGSEIEIKRIQQGDEHALLAFYNGLSERSRRMFRPLGWVATLEMCTKIVQDNLGEPSKFDMVALCEAQIVGWGFVWELASDKPIFGLGVADACQGQGLGSMLIDRVMGAAREQDLRHVYLTVVQDNHVAYNLYTRRGFVRYDECKGDDGLDYYCMVAHLVGP